MERQAALVLCIIFFAIFGTIAYYGARITLWSSIIFGLFIALIILVIFYPPSTAATNTADFTLVLYAIILILGFVLLFIYIVQKTLNDVRCVYM
jgi:hypothetical protein